MGWPFSARLPDQGVASFKIAIGGTVIPGMVMALMRAPEAIPMRSSMDRAYAWSLKQPAAACWIERLLLQLPHSKAVGLKSASRFYPAPIPTVRSNGAAAPKRTSGSEA
jgi:hypothetical protein